MKNLDLYKIFAVAIAALIGIYIFIYHLYIFPKLSRVKWIKKVLGLGDKPPKLDFRYSGWGFLYGLGLILGLLLVGVIIVFITTIFE